METITYKGISFEAELIGGINREHKWAPGRDSYDSLFRDAAGRYYIHRWTENDTPGSLGLYARGRFTGEVITKQPTKGRRVRPPRELVHAISLNAAILWATWELGNGEPANLRADAADLLKALKTPEFSHAEGGRFALDDLARTMLQRVCREGDDCRYAGEDPRDLVNAAVTFYLCDGSDNDMHGEFDLSCGDDALKRAKQDRLKSKLVESDLHPYATPAREITVPNDNGTRRFVFTYAPHEHKPGRHLTVEVTDEQWREVKALAVHFKMRAQFFLRLLVVKQLPDQPWCRARSCDPLHEQMKAEHIAFTCLDDGMARRIERAAQARQISVDEFIAESIAGDVDALEENMIVHPVTGELLSDGENEMFSLVDEGVILPPGQQTTLEAADRSDVALCAAAAPSAEGDEDDNPQPTGDKS